MDLQQHTRFLLQQKLTLLINRYEYYLFDGGTRGALIAFAEQERFAFRESVTVWANSNRSETLFTIKAEKILDVHGNFMVRDAEGVPLGYCRKAFTASLLRSTWEVYDSKDALLFTAKERSQTMALIRRVAQFVPYLSDIAPFFPFNFDFEKSGHIVGAHNRVWGSLTDQYEQIMERPIADIDKRLVLALGILLDALQDR